VAATNARVGLEPKLPYVLGRIDNDFFGSLQSGKRHSHSMGLCVGKSKVVHVGTIHRKAFATACDHIDLELQIVVSENRFGRSFVVNYRQIRGDPVFIIENYVSSALDSDAG